MKHVIFLHGAYHAGWCWVNVIKLLPVDTFVCHPLDLPGNGNNKLVAKSQVTIEDYVQYVIQYIIDRDINDIIFVSHSLGGVTLSKLVEKIPNRITHAVFLTSVILDGRSFLQLLPEEVQSKYKEVALSRSDRSIPPNIDRIKTVLFSQSSDSIDLSNFLNRLEPQPLHIYEESVSLASFTKTSVPVTYVRCTYDKSLPEETFKSILSLLPLQASVKDIIADHEAMFSNPAAVATIILGKI